MSGAYEQTAMVLVDAGDGSLVARARALLTQAVTVEQAKQLRDQAAAIAFFARERGESAELVMEATEARIWFERRIGELTSELSTRRGARRDKEPSPRDGLGCVPTKQEALEAAGLSKQQASRF